MADWHSLTNGERSLLERLFWAGKMSRGELTALTGFSKSKANVAIANLISRNFLEEVGTQPSSGGRRPEMLRLSHQLGILASVDIGATSIDVALLTPDMEILDHQSEPAAVRDGPVVIFDRVAALLGDALSRFGITADQLIAIGVGVPGPVAFDSDMLFNPPLLPGWESFSIRDHLMESHHCPVFVDNDVNVLALGTHWRLQAQLRNFMVIKIGTGIGCGIICHGAIYRGLDGAAGDVGHVCIDPDGPPCYCGNYGCLEALAGGPALARKGEQAARDGRSPIMLSMLDAAGSLTAADVGAACRAGDRVACQIVQDAGTDIGRMLATVVNFYNPSHIFVSGGLIQLGPQLLSSIRQSVYQRSLALSTRNLEIQYVSQMETLGVVGTGVMALQELLLARK